MRIESRNPWASAIEAQRGDLWVVDLKAVSFLEDIGLKEHFFYASSISLPEKAIGTDLFFRDSSAYVMPGYDQPLGEIRISFIHDVSTLQEGDIRRSKIYRLIETWHRLSRAGRGATSREGVFLLDENYKVPSFRFDILVRMACGYPLLSPAGEPLSISGISNDSSSNDGNSTLEGVQSEAPDGPSMEMSSSYTIVKAWLAKFKLADLSYEGGASIHKIDCFFCAEDIIPTP